MHSRTRLRLYRCGLQWFAILEQDNGALCRSVYFDIESDSPTGRRIEKISHARRLRACCRSEIENAVRRSGEIDEDVSGTNGRQDRGGGELVRVDDGGRTADGARLVERRHGAMAVAATEGGEPVAEVELMLPERNAGIGRIFASAIDGLNRIQQI